MGARDGSIPYHKEERDDSGGKAPGQCLCSMRVCRPTKGHTRSSCDKACRHKHPQNQSCVGSSGRTLTTNVSMTLCDSQIRHQTHVLCGCTTFGTELKLGPKSCGNNTHCCTDKGVALARGGGGGTFLAGVFDSEDHAPQGPQEWALLCGDDRGTLGEPMRRCMRSRALSTAQPGQGGQGGSGSQQHMH